ncbi:site-specific integrase [Bacillus sp. S/N-304-OC-R1]|uniref:tyrosine-type recombinase/integrase n=1 Tax=Bacillus sp. S/N-304-OC-R1 TaxID=2758034 RepID=UPI001C8DDAFB|nr:site-specific integrase [Bacillus sp. S/N-304-OC-R1]MBY0120916.1 site-specific integrase [Bacillus sp. S/N-304-OC-R1]
MKGSIKKDKNTGKYFYIVDIGKDPLTGKRKQKRKKGFCTKKEAEIALTELLKELNEGFLTQSKISLDDYMNTWFKERKVVVQKSTLRTNFSFYRNYISPSIGRLSIQELTPIVLQSFANTLINNGQLSVGTIHKIFDILKVAINRAVKLRVVKENYTSYVELPKKQKKEMNVWDNQQVNLFIQRVKSKRIDDHFLTAYLLALLTGMRQGEILGLRWKDVDFDKKQLYIRQVLTHDGKELRVGTKTASGTRTISISDNLVSYLRQSRKKLLENKLMFGSKYVDNDLVVCTKKGKPVNPSNLLKTFKKDVEETGLPCIRFHDLRHTHATLLIEKDINPKVIQERLGHARIGITLDIYSHVLPSMQQHVADKLDEIMII